MELSNSESQYLFELLGTHTGSIKGLKEQIAIHIHESKMDQQELRRELKELSVCSSEDDVEACKEAINVAKGERVYVFGSIGVISGVLGIIGGALIAKFFELF